MNSRRKHYGYSNVGCNTFNLKRKTIRSESLHRLFLILFPRWIRSRTEQSCGLCASLSRAANGQRFACHLNRGVGRKVGATSYRWRANLNKVSWLRWLLPSSAAHRKVKRNIAMMPTHLTKWSTDCMLLGTAVNSVFPGCTNDSHRGNSQSPKVVWYWHGKKEC